MSTGPHINDADRLAALELADQVATAQRNQKDSTPSWASEQEREAARVAHVDAVDEAIRDFLKRVRPALLEAYTSGAELRNALRRYMAVDTNPGHVGDTCYRYASKALGGEDPRGTLQRLSPLLPIRTRR